MLTCNCNHFEISQLTSQLATHQAFIASYGELTIVEFS